MGGDKAGLGSILAMFSSIVIGAAVIDQATKSIARSHLTPGHPVTAIPGLFDFELVFNKGAAFGMFQNATTWFIISTSLVLLGITAYLVIVRPKSRFLVTVLSLIAAGAVGNGMDRAFLDGTVTDFIATTFISFPVFNVADICVTCGCILMIVYAIFSPRLER